MKSFIVDVVRQPLSFLKRSFVPAEGMANVRPILVQPVGVSTEVVMWLHEEFGSIFCLGTANTVYTRYVVTEHTHNVRVDNFDFILNLDPVPVISLGSGFDHICYNLKQLVSEIKAEMLRLISLPAYKQRILNMTDSQVLALFGGIEDNTIHSSIACVNGEENRFVICQNADFRAASIAANVAVNSVHLLN